MAEVDVEQSTSANGTHGQSEAHTQEPEPQRPPTEAPIEEPIGDRRRAKIVTGVALALGAVGIAARARKRARAQQERRRGWAAISAMLRPPERGRRSACRARLHKLRRR